MGTINKIKIPSPRVVMALAHAETIEDFSEGVFYLAQADGR
jgi:hypothetical protein